jgi:hypothetical protein
LQGFEDVLVVVKAGPELLDHEVGLVGLGRLGGLLVVGEILRHYIEGTVPQERCMGLADGLPFGVQLVASSN